MKERIRPRKKEKRLDAICEKVYNSNRLVQAESNEGNTCLESEEVIRRSARVRKAPAVLDASPLSLRKKQRVDDGGVSLRRKSERGKKKKKEEEEELEKESVVVESGDGEGKSGWKCRLRSRGSDISLETRETRSFWRGQKPVFDEVKGESKDSKKEEVELVVDGKTDGDDNDEKLSNEGIEEVVANRSTTQLLEEEKSKMMDTHEEETDKKTEQVEGDKTREERDVEVGNDVDEVGNGESRADKDACTSEPGKKQFEEVDKPKGFLTDKLHKSRVREGRRCGLCGRASDGRPPKRLVKDYADSDNEGYGGSSSEEANYDTWDGFGDEPGWLGRLLGPIHDRFGIAGVWVHHQCAVWSPEVYFAGLGCLKNVRAALFRGRALKCSRCGRPGATIGCRVDRCPKTYHLPCGRADSCIFDHRKFLIACVDHRHLFQPHGNQYLHRIKKLKAKKLKLEMRKRSHDAWRNDCEAEEKWLENCGEDEEFLKREGKRLHRDILRIAPVYIGGPSSNNENLYQGWESVAGLQDVIQCMKEVVLLPLLYPEFFTSLGLTPPRGVLLHGYPGTGKTLVVRALIGSCARGDRRIAYFARKGADCLGKYVGDAERQLRLLFQVAEKSQPSIIFFDEIDGLAPCRTRQQDQTHNSVVSTLLALMDGLKSRGSVIVIGATNRPDAVDPALRRPGRFDREIYFPLPSVEDRASILSVHTRKWPRPVSGSLLKFVAQKTAGFAGADLQALCTQAAMIALKRNCDLQKLMSAAEKKAGNGCRLPPLSFPVEEKDWLDALSHAPQPCSRREAGMAANDVVSSPLHLHLAPCLLQPLSHLLVSLYCDERVLLPPFLYKAAKMIETVMISAMENISMSNDAWLSHLPDYTKEADIAKQIERGLSSVGFLTGTSISSNSDVLNDDTDAHKQFKLHRPSQAGPSTLVKNGSSLLGRKSGFRVLITGHPKSGQRHLASCLLHGFVGCVEIQKVDLATISQEGNGDVAEGMTQILLTCLSKDLCVVYMPRIDLWAVEIPHEIDEEHDISGNTFTSDDTARICDTKRIASPLWNTFMEQVDSTHLSASLTILATSEVSCQDLPHKICKFFTSDVLKVRDSIPSQHTLPRFIVQTDGNFDCDAVINSSALELSCSIIQHYVQLLHEKTHTVNLLEECRDGSILEGKTETESQDNGVVSDIPGGDASCGGDKTREHRNGDEQCLPMSNTAGPQDDEVKLCHPPDAGPRVVSNNRTVKGKSSLLLAISSFGYQILRYPHFSELCWATSKLKDGPCTDISGPWKGWPFNSCMIRPSNSLEKVPLGCSSTNHKNKEYTGEVRGLIAVGLLAYRGVYASVREVAFEVRKVLELVAEQVSAKIVGGKDRYCFLRLLSQVAYLEDMVNSWAYTLQSLERDSQMTFSNPRQTVLGHPDNHLPSECNPVGSEPKVFPKNSNEVQMHEQSPSVPTEGNEFARSQKGVANLGLPNSGARIAISGNSSQDMASLAYAAPGSLLPLTSENTLTMQNKVNNAENSVSENHLSIGVLHGSFESSKQANGLAKERPILRSEDENSIDREMNLVSKSSKGTGSEHPTCLSKGLPSEDCTPNPDEIVGAVNFAQKKNNGASTVSKPACLYRCCPDCLCLVYVLIQKMLIHERDVFGSCWTVEDVHDIVASWSVNLLSAVRELINLRSVSENMIDENIGNICACSNHIQLKETSRHKSSSLVVPLECHFHSEKSVTEKTTACTNSLSELGLNFFVRDNILITSEMGMDALFHCKFESLCLGTLIGYLSTIKNPLD